MAGCEHNFPWVIEDRSLGHLLWRHVICTSCRCALLEKTMTPSKRAPKPREFVRVIYAMVKTSLEIDLPWDR